MNSKKEKYADLLVRCGINIKKDQTLLINTPLECADFARSITKKAYEAGAREVILNWNDELSTKIRYDMAPEEIFDEFPAWRVEMLNSLADRDAAFLSISASDPELMKEVDPSRIARFRKASSSALGEYRSRVMGNFNAWCVVSVPTEAWARKVFPQAGEGAMDLLWEAIFKAVRVDRDDPVAAWKELQNSMSRRIEILHKYNFTSLHYKNSLGTDLLVELPENHLWVGGGEETKSGQKFIANMPTEEIFTAPSRRGVNGKVCSSLPLCYNGNLIEGIELEFKEGRVVSFEAAKGKEVLAGLLDTDEGARRLGEVALVPFDSPISNQNILFYNTLFDENASCHFALGKAYPICVKGGDEMDEESLKEAGLNDSLTHVDFMIGTEDLEITGITATGEEIPLFRKGNFAGDFA
ncbi:MAG: aminopeptidase [Spirochaetales bacterium]|nr:aminopeptidase [Spirochaetales bacterium]